MNKLNQNTLLFPILLVFYETTAYLSNDAYLPALPSMAKALHTTNHLAQISLTMWFLGAASVQLVVGPVADRYGRRPVLLMGGIIFVLSTLFCALTHSINVLLIARFIQGATVTTIVVAGYATIHELFEQKQAIHTIAIMRAVSILAPAFGPFLGAVIIYFIDWRWIFGVLAIWGAIAIIALYFKMPETCSKEQQQPLRFKKSFQQYRVIFSNVIFLRHCLASSFLFGAMIAWLVAGPFLVMDAFKYSEFYYAFLQLLVFGSFILTTGLVKPLMKMLPLNKIINVGLGLSLLGGVLTVIFSIAFPTNLWPFIIAMMLLVGGCGLAFSILSRLAVEASDQPMGTRVAAYTTLQCILSVFASVVVSIVYDGNLISIAYIMLGLSVVPFLLRVIKQ